MDEMEWFLVGEREEGEVDVDLLWDRVEWVDDIPIPR